MNLTPLVTTVARHAALTVRDTEELAIGQRVKLFGALSGPALDTSTGTSVARMQPTRIFGFAKAGPSGRVGVADSNRAPGLHGTPISSRGTCTIEVTGTTTCVELEVVDRGIVWVTQLPSSPPFSPLVGRRATTVSISEERHVGVGADHVVPAVEDGHAKVAERLGRMRVQPGAPETFNGPKSSEHPLLKILSSTLEPGKSSEWILGHVRADKEQLTKEIVGAGFRLVDEVQVAGFARAAHAFPRR